MKKALNIMMNNKYFLLIFCCLCFFLKFLFDQYGIPQTLSLGIPVVKMAFWITLGICASHFILLLILSLVWKNKKEEWWEAKEDHKSSNKIVDFLFKSLVISIPVMMYCIPVYFALTQSWRMIFFMTAIIAIGTLVDRFNNRKNKTAAE